MHIGLLIYGDIDAVSGGYLYNRQLVAYLRSKGDQVTIISFPYRNYQSHITDNFKSACLKQLTAAKVDVLIQDAMVHPSVFLLNQQFYQETKIPIIGLVHLLTSVEQHSRLNAWFYRAIEYRYFQSVSGLILNSQTTLQQVKKLTTQSIKPFCIAVPAGNNFKDIVLDINKIKQRCLSLGSLKILVVSNVIRRKGLHVLIKALGLLPHQDYQVTVAGRLDMEPKYVQQLKKAIKHHLLETQIFFKGPIQGQALADLYLTHHIMVLPSAYESYGIVYVEAQQFALPVFGTTAGAAKEIIKHGVNGYLIEPEDHQALAILLQTMYQDRALLYQLSQNACHAYKQQPKWPESCEIIRRFLYRQLSF